MPGTDTGPGAFELRVPWIYCADVSMVGYFHFASTEIRGGGDSGWLGATRCPGWYSLFRPLVRPWLRPFCIFVGMSGVKADLRCIFCCSPACRVSPTPTLQQRVPRAVLKQVREFTCVWDDRVLGSFFISLLLEEDRDNFPLLTSDVYLA